MRKLVGRHSCPAGWDRRPAGLVWTGVPPVPPGNSTWLLLGPIVFALTLLLSPRLPAGGPKPAALEGVWNIKSSTTNGKQNPEVEFKDVQLVIKKDTYELVRKEKVFSKGTFKLDAAQKPKTIDVQPVTADGKKLPSILGIYKLEGTILTVCGVKEGMPRPTDFTCKEGSSRELIVYERKK